MREMDKIVQILDLHTNQDRKSYIKNLLKVYIFCFFF